MSLAAVLAVLVACDATLATGLDERDANRMVLALQGAGIGAAKQAAEGGGEGASFAVHVAPDDVAAALEVLERAALPRTVEPGLAEIFGEGGLVPTPTEERARWVAALSGELARSIEGMDGVVDARVHIALPDARPIRLDDSAPPRATASVLIKHAASAEAPRDVDVRALVAGAVPELAAADVAVVAVRVAEATPPANALVQIGPIAVSRGSASIARAFGVGALVLHLVLAGALVFVLMRRRREEVAVTATVPGA